MKVRYELQHLMLPPEPGKDHGPSLCGTPGITVLFDRNVTCPACKAQIAERPSVTFLHA